MFEETKNVLMRYFSAQEWCFSINTLAVENKTSFEIKLDPGYMEDILKIEVDDCLFKIPKFKRLKKCDYAFQRSLNNSFIFVELKGEAIIDGIEQLKSTVNEFTKAFDTFGKTDTDTLEINNSSLAYVIHTKITTRSSNAITNQ